MSFETIPRSTSIPPHEHRLHRISGWRPSYLRRRVLLAFFIVFCMIIAALESLNRLSERHNGIASSIESRHYFWTYGPTAILTVIASFWSRVEFQAKQSAPWHSLQKGPQIAEKSMLMDYISLIQPVAIWRALRNKDFVVAAGVTTSILLRLLIVLSTGLFSLQQVHVQKVDVPILIHSNFDAEKSSLDGLGSEAYDLINGILFQNITYPAGSTANFAFQQFSAPSLPSDAIVTVEIEGLMSDLDCEVAEVINKGPCTVDFSTPSCNISDVSQQWCFINESDVSSTSVGYMQERQCINTNSSDGKRITTTVLVLNTNVSTDIEAAQNEKPNQPGMLNNASIRAVAVVCKPSLVSLRLKATNQASGPMSDAHFEILDSKIATLPDLVAADMINPAMCKSDAFDATRDISRYHLKGLHSWTGLSLLAGVLLAGEDYSFENLFQPEVLANITTSYYRAMTAQLLRMSHSQGIGARTMGQANVLESRVLVSKLPLRAMEACLALAMVILTVIWILAPRGILATWNPNYILGLAAILAKSNDLRNILYGTATSTTEHIRSCLLGRRYYSDLKTHGTTISSLGEADHQPASSFSIQKKAAWKPFPSLISRVVGFSLIAMIIAVLEIVLYFSQRQTGLADVSSDEYMHYLWTILPALIMVLLGLFYSSLDFNTRCLTPYAHLKRPNGATIRQSLDVTFLDTLGLYNVFLSVQHKHFAVLATTLATATTLFLTIITSGLYSVIEIPRQFESNFTQNGSFPNPKAISWVDLRLVESGEPFPLPVEEAGETVGILTAKYILQGNLAFPSWSWDDLVFPKLVPHHSPDLGSVESSYVDIQIPALRAAPSCRLQMNTELNPTITNSDTESNATNTFDLAVDLVYLPCSRNDPDNILTDQRVFEKKKLQSQYFGYSRQSICYKANPSTSDRTIYTNSYIWGQLSDNSVKSVTALTCMQYAETITVAVRLKLPELEIVADHPPVPDESTAKLAPGAYVPVPFWKVLGSDSPFPLMDPFFYLLVTGKYGIPLQDVGREDQIEKVVNAIKHQSKLISAQQFNLFSRTVSNETTSRPTLLGTITMPGRLRLVQDATSTRILEGLLGALLILGILGSILLNTDHVLSKNPCSIAAAASLLADSNLMDQPELKSMQSNDKSVHLERLADFSAYLDLRESNSTDETSHPMRDEVPGNLGIYIALRDAFLHKEQTSSGSDIGTIREDEIETPSTTSNLQTL